MRIYKTVNFVLEGTLNFVRDGTTNIGGTTYRTSSQEKLCVAGLDEWFRVRNRTTGEVFPSFSLVLCYSTKRVGGAYKVHQVENSIWDTSVLYVSLDDFDVNLLPWWAHVEIALAQQMARPGEDLYVYLETYA